MNIGGTKACTPNQVRIPVASDHRFRCKVDHLFRSKPDQAFRCKVGH
jgi:hypothetical protein